MRVSPVSGRWHTDNLQQTTLVDLTEVVVNEPIDPSRFEFLVPADVDVVGVPAAADTLDP